MNNKLQHFIDKDKATVFSQSSIFRPLGSNSETFGSFLIATTENNKINCVQGVLTPRFRNWFSSFSIHESKEELYLTALDNLLKKVDYLHLTLQLDQNLIDEEEFDKELEENEDKYLIKINHDFNSVDLQLIMSITSKLKNRKFSSDEISEIFSVDIDKIEDFIDNHKVHFLEDETGSL